MPRPVPNLAAIVGDNVVPIAGVLLLGWKAANLVVIYFAGFLLDIAACLLLLWKLAPDRPVLDGTGTPAGRLKAALAMGLGVLVLLAVFAFVFGMPVMAVIHGDPGITVKGLLADRGFVMAIAVHMLMAAHGFFQVHRDLAARMRADPAFGPVAPVRRRFAFVTSRWVVVLAASFFLAIPVVLVIAYCAASIWFEMRPPAAGEGPAG